MLDHDSCRLLAQLFGTFLSLLGVYVVFRLNSAREQIRDALATIASVAGTPSMGRSIQHQPPRERIETVINWLGNPNDPMRRLFNSFQGAMNDLFNTMGERVQIIDRFRKLIRVCGVLIATFIVGAISLDDWVGWTVALGTVFLVGWIVWFIDQTMLHITDWEGYWKLRQAEWKKLEKELSP